MFAPTGAIVRTMRLSDTTVSEDGTTTRKLLSSGSGVIVHVRPTSDARKKFREFCQHHNIIATAAERNGNVDGLYNRRTGEERAVDYREDANVTAWQCVGPGPALAKLVGMGTDGCRGTPKWFVADWAFALSIRIPVGAAGSGPEKVRPSVPSAFGKRAAPASRTRECPDRAPDAVQLSDVLAHIADVTGR